MKKSHYNFEILYIYIYYIGHMTESYNVVFSVFFNYYCLFRLIVFQFN